MWRIAMPARWEVEEFENFYTSLIPTPYVSKLTDAQRTQVRNLVGRFRMVDHHSAAPLTAGGGVWWADSLKPACSCICRGKFYKNPMFYPFMFTQLSCFGYLYSVGIKYWLITVEMEILQLRIYASFPHRTLSDDTFFPFVAYATNQNRCDTIPSIHKAGRWMVWEHNSPVLGCCTGDFGVVTWPTIWLQGADGTSPDYHSPRIHSLSATGTGKYYTRILAIRLEKRQKVALMWDGNVKESTYYSCCFAASVINT